MDFKKSFGMMLVLVSILSFAGGSLQAGEGGYKLSPPVWAPLVKERMEAKEGTGKTGSIPSKAVPKKEDASRRGIHTLSSLNSSPSANSSPPAVPSSPLASSKEGWGFFIGFFAGGGICEIFFSDALQSMSDKTTEWVLQKLEKKGVAREKWGPRKLKKAIPWITLHGASLLMGCGGAVLGRWVAGKFF